MLERGFLLKADLRELLVLGDNCLQLRVELHHSLLLVLNQSRHLASLALHLTDFLLVGVLLDLHLLERHKLGKGLRKGGNFDRFGYDYWFYNNLF